MADDSYIVTKPSGEKVTVVRTGYGYGERQPDNSIRPIADVEGGGFNVGGRIIDTIKYTKEPTQNNITTNPSEDLLQKNFPTSPVSQLNTNAEQYRQQKFIEENKGKFPSFEYTSQGLTKGIAYGRDKDNNLERVDYQYTTPSSQASNDSFVHSVQPTSKVFGNFRPQDFLNKVEESTKNKAGERNPLVGLGLGVGEFGYGLVTNPFEMIRQPIRLGYGFVFDNEKTMEEMGLIGSQIRENPERFVGQQVGAGLLGFGAEKFFELPKIQENINILNDRSISFKDDLLKSNSDISFGKNVPSSETLPKFYSRGQIIKILGGEPKNILGSSMDIKYTQDIAREGLNRYTENPSNYLMLNNELRSRTTSIIPKISEVNIKETLGGNNFGVRNTRINLFTGERYTNTLMNFNGKQFARVDVLKDNVLNSKIYNVEQFYSGSPKQNLIYGTEDVLGIGKPYTIPEKYSVNYGKIKKVLDIVRGGRIKYFMELPKESIHNAGYYDYKNININLIDSTRINLPKYLDRIFGNNNLGISVPSIVPKTDMSSTLVHEFGHFSFDIQREYGMKDFGWLPKNVREGIVEQIGYDISLKEGKSYVNSLIYDTDIASSAKNYFKILKYSKREIPEEMLVRFAEKYPEELVKPSTDTGKFLKDIYPKETISYSPEIKVSGLPEFSEPVFKEFNIKNPSRPQRLSSTSDVQRFIVEAPIEGKNVVGANAMYYNIGGRAETFKLPSGDIRSVSSFVEGSGKAYFKGRQEITELYNVQPFISYDLKSFSGTEQNILRNHPVEGLPSEGFTVTGSRPAIPVFGEDLNYNNIVGFRKIDSLLHEDINNLIRQGKGTSSARVLPEEYLGQQVGYKKIFPKVRQTYTEGLPSIELGYGKMSKSTLSNRVINRMSELQFKKDIISSSEDIGFRMVGNERVNLFDSGFKVVSSSNMPKFSGVKAMTKSIVKTLSKPVEKVAISPMSLSSNFGDLSSFVTYSTPLSRMEYSMDFSGVSRVSPLLFRENSVMSIGKPIVKSIPKSISTPISMRISQSIPQSISIPVQTPVKINMPISKSVNINVPVLNPTSVPINVPQMFKMNIPQSTRSPPIVPKFFGSGSNVPFVFNDFDSGRKKKRKQKRSFVLKSVYAPTVEAVLFNTHGREPKGFLSGSGLILRPLVS